MTGQGDDDAYLDATRLLTYELLHAPDTRVNTTSVNFLVLCSSSVPITYKQQLQKDGAIVIEVDDVPVDWWIKSNVGRWKEQFTKLRVFEITEYQRILFIDADTMIFDHLDPIFHEPEVVPLIPTFTFPPQVQAKTDELPPPSEWLFAARSDNGYTGMRNHLIPPLQSLNFGAGFFIIAPNLQLFTYLRSIMSHWRRFDSYTMEQSLLSYAFRRNGPMPWRELHWKWSVMWPTEIDKQMGVVTLHDKFWGDGSPQPLREIWKAKMQEMRQYHRKS